MSFKNITLRAERDLSLPTWAQYKYYYEIVDTKKTQGKNDDTIRDTKAENKILKPSNN